MNNDFNCICNMCGTEFKPIANIHVVDKEKEVRITYIECPNCNKRYFAGITDNEYEAMLIEFRKRQEEIREAMQKNLSSRQ